MPRVLGPAAPPLLHRLATNNGFIRDHPFPRQEDEGERLPATLPAMGSDQFLERVDLLLAGIVRTVDHDVGDVRKAIAAPHETHRRAAERRKRILDLDHALMGLLPAAPAQAHTAATPCI